MCSVVGEAFWGGVCRWSLLASWLWTATERLSTRHLAGLRSVLRQGLSLSWWSRCGRCRAASWGPCWVSSTLSLRSRAVLGWLSWRKRSRVGRSPRLRPGRRLGGSPNTPRALRRGVVRGRSPGSSASVGVRTCRPCGRRRVSGAVSVPVALTVVSEFARLKPRLREEAAPTVLNGLLEMGIADGPSGVRSLRPALLAVHGADGEFQADADTTARLVSLSRPSTDELGALTYQLILDPVGAAALEAAIGPLSAPVPGPDGQRDARSPQIRRGQALVEVCRRATSAGDRPPSGVKTTLMLTMSYDDLAARVGAATVIGSAQGGSLLAPETVRRLACDAAIIPTVLGGRGEILELGRSTRLATPGQLAALWLRDAGCTFPGCTTPARWCDAHHLVHWADGGKTDLSNLALLCGRHHSVAHRDQLVGLVTDPGAVTWNLIPGSYQRRDDGPPALGDHASGDRPPSDPPVGGRPSGDPPPSDPPTPLGRPTANQHAWDTPAPDADPWIVTRHPHEQTAESEAAGAPIRRSPSGPAA